MRNNRNLHLSAKHYNLMLAQLSVEKAFTRHLVIH